MSKSFIFILGDNNERVAWDGMAEYVSRDQTASTQTGMRIIHIFGSADYEQHRLKTISG